MHSANLCNFMLHLQEVQCIVRIYAIHERAGLPQIISGTQHKYGDDCIGCVVTAAPTVPTSTAVLSLCASGQTNSLHGGFMHTYRTCAPVPTPPSASPLHGPDQWVRCTSSLGRCHSSQRTAPQSPQHLQAKPHMNEDASVST
jgi:hypothetical protein